MPHAKKAAHRRSWQDEFSRTLDQVEALTLPETRAHGDDGEESLVARAKRLLGIIRDDLHATPDKPSPLMRKAAELLAAGAQRAADKARALRDAAADKLADVASEAWRLVVPPLAILLALYWLSKN